MASFPKLKFDRASLGTVVSFVIGAYGVIGELRSPVKDLPSLAFFCGLMGAPVVFPGAGERREEKKENREREKEK